MKPVAHKHSLLALIALIAIMTFAAPGTYAQQQLTAMRLDAPIVTAALSPDGRYVAVNVGNSKQHGDGSWDSTERIEIVEESASNVVARIEIPDAVLLKDAPLAYTDGYLSYCDNGKYLVAYDLMRTVYVIDANTFQIASRIGVGNLRAHEGGAFLINMTCSTGGSVFGLSVNGGNFGWGLLKMFDITTGKQIAELRQNSSSGTEFSSISLSPSGLKIAVLLRDPKWKRIKGPDVEIRETKNLNLLSRVATNDAPRGLAFAGESEIVTIQEQPSGWSPPKQALRLWNVESGNEERRFSDAHFDVEGPISASESGKEVLGSVIKYHECTLCNGFEGEIDVQEQRFAVWDKDKGTQVFRSDPFGPLIEPLGAVCILSQDGGTVLVYWPDSLITPKIFSIPK
jgi:hypothetical protein